MFSCGSYEARMVGQLEPQRQRGTRRPSLIGSLLVGVVIFAACAAPAPTATPTTAPVAAPTKAEPTPTKAPTATPTKRPLTKFLSALSSESLVWMGYLLAMAKGYYQEEGLDFEWIQVFGSAKITAAVVSGDLHMGTQASSGPLTAVNQGWPIKIVGGTSVSGAQNAVIRKDVAQQRGITPAMPLAEKVKAVRGLTLVSTSKGGDSDQLLVWLLQRYGLDPERDVERTFISKTEDGLAALQRGVVDVIIYGPPVPKMAVTAGYGIDLFDVYSDIPEMRKRLYSVLTVNSERVAQYPELIEAALRAIWRGSKYLFEDPEGAKRDLRSMPSFREMPQDAFDIGFAAQKAIQRKEPMVTREDVKATIDIHNELADPQDRVNVTPEQVWDGRYAEAAKKQLGY